MIISCPACQTKYTVPAQSFGATGRIVKCTKCAHKWHQEASTSFEPQGTQFDPDGTDAQKGAEDAKPSLADVTQPTPQQAAAQQTETAPRPSRLESQAAEQTPPYSPHQLPALPTMQSPQNMWPGVILGIAATIGLIGAVLVLKDPMMRAFPAMSQAFNGGATVAEFDPSYNQAPGLVIENIERDILEDDGFTTYVIQGIVTNSNLAERAVPNLTVSLLDEHGGVLDSWKVEPQKRVLQPGESTTWVCYFYNPPLAKVSEYKVAFATQS